MRHWDTDRSPPIRTSIRCPECDETLEANMRYLGHGMIEEPESIECLNGCPLNEPVIRRLVVEQAGRDMHEMNSADGW